MQSVRLLYPISREQLQDIHALEHRYLHSLSFYLSKLIARWLPPHTQSIQAIIPQLQQRPDQLIAHPRHANRIMVHRVRDEGLAPSDPPRRLHRKVKGDVHVVDVYGRVDGDGVPRELAFVVESRPAGRVGEDVGGGGEGAEFVVVGEG